MYLMAPRPSFAELPVFYNVEGVVGAPPAENRREEVMFVQFVFTVMAKNPLPTTPAPLLNAAKAVHLTGVCDPMTIAAIRAFQEDMKKDTPQQIVDGRVSPVRSGYTYSGKAGWIIIHMNDALQNRHVDLWPRIDKIPGCPGELVEMVRRNVAGK